MKRNKSELRATWTSRHRINLVYINLFFWNWFEDLTNIIKRGWKIICWRYSFPGTTHPLHFLPVSYSNSPFQNPDNIDPAIKTIIIDPLTKNTLTFSNLAYFNRFCIRIIIFDHKPNTTLKSIQCALSICITIRVGGRQMWTTLRNISAWVENINEFS